MVIKINVLGNTKVPNVGCAKNVRFLNYWTNCLYVPSYDFCCHPRNPSCTLCTTLSPLRYYSCQTSSTTTRGQTWRPPSTLPLSSLPSPNTNPWHHSVIVWFERVVNYVDGVYTSTNPRRSLGHECWIHSSTSNFGYHSRGGLDSGGSEWHVSKLTAFVSINFS